MSQRPRIVIEKVIFQLPKQNEDDEPEEDTKWVECVKECTDSEYNHFLQLRQTFEEKINKRNISDEEKAKILAYEPLSDKEKQRFETDDEDSSKYVKSSKMEMSEDEDEKKKERVLDQDSDIEIINEIKAKKSDSDKLASKWKARPKRKINPPSGEKEDMDEEAERRGIPLSVIMAEKSFKYLPIKEYLETNRSKLLSADQIEAFTKIMNSNKCVHLTGVAGTGKSRLIAYIICWLACCAEKNFIVAGSTGTAANVVNCALASFVQNENLLEKEETFEIPKASTVHYAIGSLHPDFLKEFPIPEQKIVSALKYLRSDGKKKIYFSITRANIMIIDEISMFGAKTLEQLNQLLQRVRENNTPFGGIQMIFVGDFFQLPPVKDAYAFQSSAWRLAGCEILRLTTVHRQDDKKFIEILERISWGKDLDANMKELLLARCGAYIGNFDDILEIDFSKTDQVFKCPYVSLHFDNETVKKVNEELMAKLDHETQHEYVLSEIFIDYPEKDLKAKNSKNSKTKTTIKIQELTEAEIKSAREQIDDMVKGSCERKLELRKGAPVMLRINLDVKRGLCNGTIGFVVGFSEGGYPIVRFDGQTENITILPYKYAVKFYYTSGKKKNFLRAMVWRDQIPLILAGAITFHKSQGATLPKVSIDLKNRLPPGAILVALSRVRSLEDLRFSTSKLDFKFFKNTSKQVIQFYESGGKSIESEEYDKERLKKAQGSSSFYDMRVIKTVDKDGSVNYDNLATALPRKSPFLPNIVLNSSFSPSKTTKYVPGAKSSKSSVPAKKPKFGGSMFK